MVKHWHNVCECGSNIDTRTSTYISKFKTTFKTVIYGYILNKPLSHIALVNLVPNIINSNNLCKICT